MGVDFSAFKMFEFIIRIHKLVSGAYCLELTLVVLACLAKI